MALDTISILDGSTFLVSDLRPLQHVYERSLIDLAALGFTSQLYPDGSLPAAGLPWFMTEPVLPNQIERLELRDVPFRSGRVHTGNREFEEVR
jgi:hypothetical protein